MTDWLFTCIGRFLPMIYAFLILLKYEIRLIAFLENTNNLEKYTSCILLNMRCNIFRGLASLLPFKSGHDVLCVRGGDTAV